VGLQHQEKSLWHPHCHRLDEVVSNSVQFFGNKVQFFFDYFAVFTLEVLVQFRVVGIDQDIDFFSQNHDL
jgi:hypothetical protein